jgi:hypothetical protein
MRKSDLDSDSFIEIGRFNNGRHSGLVSALLQNPRVLLSRGNRTSAEFFRRLGLKTRPTRI